MGKITIAAMEVMAVCLAIYLGVNLISVMALVVLRRLINL
jgi:hypothetical protein